MGDKYQINRCHTLDKGASCTNHFCFNLRFLSGRSKYNLLKIRAEKLREVLRPTYAESTDLSVIEAHQESPIKTAVSDEKNGKLTDSTTSIRRI